MNFSCIGCISIAIFCNWVSSIVVGITICLIIVISTIIIISNTIIVLSVISVIIVISASSVISVINDIIAIIEIVIGYYSSTATTFIYVKVFIIISCFFGRLLSTGLVKGCLIGYRRRSS